MGGRHDKCRISDVKFIASYGLIGISMSAFITFSFTKFSYFVD